MRRPMDMGEERLKSLRTQGRKEEEETGVGVARESVVSPEEKSSWGSGIIKAWILAQGLVCPPYSCRPDEKQWFRAFGIGPLLAGQG